MLKQNLQINFQIEIVALKTKTLCSHSMAILNLNKKKGNHANSHHSIKGSTLEDHYPQKLKSPLLDQNLLSKSTSECEDCAARFTS